MKSGSPSETLFNITLCVPRRGLNTNIPTLLTSFIPLDIPSNHVIVKVDSFGFSANNVTYQALGEHPQFRYFEFHSAPTLADSTVPPDLYGVVPVWGFGTVIRSTHPGIADGERVYGYFAPAKYLLFPVLPNEVNKFVFYVPRGHLPADRRPYNQITRCATDPQYTPTAPAEALTMLYRPLFWTAFWCEDYIYTMGYLGSVGELASTVLISSASAKTAISLAWCIRRRISQGKLDPRTKIIGLTSPGNLEYVKRLEVYDMVFVYASFPSERVFSEQTGSYTRRWTYVDVAGDDALNRTITSHFASLGDTNGTMRAWISLGLSTLSPTGERALSLVIGSMNSGRYDGGGVTSPVLPPHSRAVPSPTPFFTPTWLATRRAQIPPAVVISVQNMAWADLMRDCPAWGAVERTNGARNVRDMWERSMKEGGEEGRGKGMVWSMWDVADGDEDGQVIGNSEETDELGTSVRPKL